jgi:hypothetical protein
MSKAVLKVVRDTYTPKQTLGKMYLNDIFFCETLEDVVRDINKDGDLKDTGEAKVYGQTAIPAGTYKFIINMSNRFKKLMPLLLNVEGFEAIRIHAGNTEIDTHGCILVGLTRTRDNKIGQSQIAFTKLMGNLERFNEYEITIIDKK